jgi:cob(I)alamin adenosyltransferase
MRKGLLVVFTGNGKGKTTAALGCALRALGHGCRVCLIQFVKGPWKSGEIAALERFSGLMDIHTLGKGFMFNNEDVERNREAALKAWNFTRTVLSAPSYDLVVLDELTYLVNFNFVDEEEVIQAISGRPGNMHVIITGRNASKRLIECADMVTEMKEIRHPMNGGISCQEGIEF